MKIKSLLLTMLMSAVAFTSVAATSTTTTFATPQQLRAMYSKALNGNRQYADSLKYHAITNNSAIAANHYARLLSTESSPFYDEEMHKAWVKQFYERTEARAEKGDEEAFFDLGFALVGDLYELRPINPDYDVVDRGLSYLLRLALNGNKRAQYIYAKYALDNHRIKSPQFEVWVEKSAENGDFYAIVLLAKLDFDKGNYDKALSRLAEVKDTRPDYQILNRITVKDLVTLATYAKNHPEISFTKVGPLKNDNTTFYTSRDGLILACASYKGRVGLLQLDSNGTRVNHDAIPFIYDYIVPFSHDDLPLPESDLYFQVKPYTFRIPYKITDFRVIDRTGDEQYFDMYTQHDELIPVPADYAYDSKN